MKNSETDVVDFTLLDMIRSDWRISAALALVMMLILLYLGIGR